MTDGKTAGPEASAEQRSCERTMTSSKIIEVMARGRYAANGWWRPVKASDDGAGRYRDYGSTKFRAVEFEELTVDELATMLDEEIAVLTALQASGMAVAGWQPIETAPENIPILVFGHPYPRCPGIICVMKRLPDSDYWTLIGDQGHEGDYEIREPILWQPLPASPNSKAPDRENGDE